MRVSVGAGVGAGPAGCEQEWEWEWEWEWQRVPVPGKVEGHRHAKVVETEQPFPVDLDVGRDSVPPLHLEPRLCACDRRERFERIAHEVRPRPVSPPDVGKGSAISWHDKLAPVPLDVVVLVEKMDPAYVPVSSGAAHVCVHVYIQLFQKIRHCYCAAAWRGGHQQRPHFPRACRVAALAVDRCRANRFACLRGAHIALARLPRAVWHFPKVVRFIAVNISMSAASVRRSARAAFGGD
eukprot:1648556-Rhodomonas_salina.2